MSKMLALIVPVLLVGCAAVGVYDPPEESDSPTVRFEGKYSLLLFYRNGEDCSDGVGIAERYAPWTPNHRPLPIEPDIVTSFQIRQYGVDFGSGNIASVTCGGIFSFSPKRDTDYVFSFEELEQSCSVVFLERNRADEGSTFAVAPIRKREEKFAMTTRGAVCKN